MQKKKIVTILIVVATVILAGIAVFTAVRLYQLRQQAVAPTAPERPSAQVPEEVPTEGPQSCDLLTFTLTPPGAVICEGKLAYRDDPRNEPGDYGYLEVLILEGETVEKGEIIVFVLDPGPPGITKEITYTDILPESLEFLDSDGCTYEESTRTISCSTGGTDTQQAFRAQVADDAISPITNTAILQGEGDDPSECSVVLNLEGETPTYSCNSDCTENSQCETADSNYVCDITSNKCRHSDYLESETCEAPSTSTPSPTATPTSPPVGGSTSTPAPELPAAGIATPTIIGASAGILLILLSLMLAL